jgi:hypothetical protein
MNSLKHMPLPIFLCFFLTLLWIEVSAPYFTKEMKMGIDTCRFLLSEFSLDPSCPEFFLVSIV